MTKEYRPYISALELAERLPVGKRFFAEELNLDMSKHQLRIRMRQFNLSETKSSFKGKVAFEYFATQKDIGKIISEISSGLKRGKKALPAQPTIEDKLFNLFMGA